uniref:Chemokine interleukin-8-like domain-containing protein n=1 Tax=Anas platyrhynchos TaxID=8839 RepID=A0A8B9TMA3_ANAPL
MMHSSFFLETVYPPSRQRIKDGSGSRDQASCRGEPCSHSSFSPACHLLGPCSTMKVFAAVLAALLLLALCSPAVAHLDGVPTTCCFSYQQRPVPRSLIASAYITSSNCSQPGVILVTKKGREMCADPQAPWVKAHMKHFEKKN